MSMEKQITEIYAGVNGFMDGIGVSSVGQFLDMLDSDMELRNADLLKEIREKGILTDDMKERLNGVIKEIATRIK